jgi:type I restriction enzyme R subunit
MYPKKDLTERDIYAKDIIPALIRSGWDIQLQMLEEFAFTDGRIYVKDKLTARGERKRADYLLLYKPGIPIAIIEGKDNSNSIGTGMQQALLNGLVEEIEGSIKRNKMQAEQLLNVVLTEALLGKEEEVA